MPEPEDCSAREGCREEETVAVLESAASALAASAPTRPKPVRSSARGSDGGGGGDGEDACGACVDIRLNNRGRGENNGKRAGKKLSAHFANAFFKHSDLTVSMSTGQVPLENRLGLNNRRVVC